MKPLRIAAALMTLLACGPKQVLVVMNAQNNSGQAGVATLSEQGSKTDVLVVIHKSDAPDPQPVHFHTGRCGEIGPRYDASVAAAGLPSMHAPDPGNKDDPPPPDDGGIVFTRATLDVPFAKLTGGDFVINVHDSRDFALYVSCGNIN